MSKRYQRSNGGLLALKELNPAGSLAAKEQSLFCIYLS
jgi:hypothetical protein